MTAPARKKSQFAVMGRNRIIHTYFLDKPTGSPIELEKDSTIGPCRVFTDLIISDAAGKRKENNMNTHVVIAGTGSRLPKFILTNHALSRMVDTSDEWIVSHTGIRTRHICTDETLLDLAQGAARAALENAGMSPDELDLIIVASSTQEMLYPSIACQLQAALGADRAFGFDMGGQACAGFLFALDAASRYVRTGGAKTVLCVSAEKLSLTTDFTDRGTCCIFGDGAGAVVLRAGEAPGLLASYLATAGSRGSYITCSLPWPDNPFSKLSQMGLPPAHTRMDGHEVFKFAVRAVPEAIDAVLEKAGLGIADISKIILHQANLRIIESAINRYGLPPEKFPITIDRHGNTSSASIPLVLDELNRAGELRPGDKLIFVAFGGGLTYGSVLVEWRAEGKEERYEQHAAGACK